RASLQGDTRHEHRQRSEPQDDARQINRPAQSGREDDLLAGLQNLLDVLHAAATHPNRTIARNVSLQTDTFGDAYNRAHKNKNEAVAAPAGGVLAMSLDPGSRFGTYDVEALIGAGGMGDVYRATDTTLKRRVALKVLSESFVGDTNRLARLQREAELLAALNH